uniref:Uncharacterized protein n=1 Tax=Sphaerodactylus townsendi TaxID=933632 RepID=A0ACB8FZ87_9SAUR
MPLLVQAIFNGDPDEIRMLIYKTEDVNALSGISAMVCQASPEIIWMYLTAYHCGSHHKASNWRGISYERPLLAADVILSPEYDDTTCGVTSCHGTANPSPTHPIPHLTCTE